MAFAHAPLPDDVLGDAVLRVIGPSAPPPLRMMAARGLAPLPPRDMLVALYQLWVQTEDRLHSEAAASAVEQLPANVILGTLSDTTLPPGLLDLISRKHIRSEQVLEKLVRHVGVDDETLSGVARICPESICDILAENQVRWLKHPQIAENLYFNRACRMSTINRVIELADREGIELKIPMFDEIKQAVRHDGVDPERDKMVGRLLAAGDDAQAQAKAIELMQQAAATDPLALEELELGSAVTGSAESEVPPETETPPEAPADEDAPEQTVDQIEEAIRRALESPEPAEVPEDDGGLAKSRDSRLTQLVKMKSSEKIRAALLGDAYDRSVLIRDANKVVAISVIKSPKLKETEVVAFAANRSLSHDVIRHIANKREWTKLYTVKLNLVMNPKTPLANAMTLLAFLSANDVRRVARSKNVPSALAQAARRKENSRK